MAVIIPSVSGFPLGLAARRSIGITDNGQATRITFRVRRNNGAAGGVAGQIYQDCFTYVYPTNPGTPAQLVCQSKFAAAISAWQALTESQKDVYRERAIRSKYATGYSLFLSEYLTSN